MPQGKGTYGSKVGRPSKKKYYGRGSVDPFYTKNPEGVPAKQVAGAMEEQNMAKSIEDAMPTVNAMERSQTMPDTEKYDKGGKVKSKKINVTDVVKDVKIREGMIKGAIPKAYYDWERGLRSGEIKRKKKEILKGKKK